MSDKKNEITLSYRGENGAAYHARKHSLNPAVYECVARNRALKFQPLIDSIDTVLEYGVGTGLNLLFVQCRAKTGYDLSSAGKEICEAHGIVFLQEPGDIEAEGYSVVLCSHVLEHVPDPLQTLTQLHSFLKPGGRLILCVPYEVRRRYRKFIANDPDRHLFSWNVQTIGNLVSTIGFQIEQNAVSPYGYEQRLAHLSRWSFSLYRSALWIVRHVRQANEILVVARKPSCE